LGYFICFDICFFYKIFDFWSKYPPPPKKKYDTKFVAQLEILE